MNFCFVNLKKKGLLITFFLIIDLEINPFGGLIICFKNGERFMLCVSNSHKHKEANLKKKKPNPPLRTQCCTVGITIYFFSQESELLKTTQFFNLEKNTPNSCFSGHLSKLPA